MNNHVNRHFLNRHKPHTPTGRPARKRSRAFQALIAFAVVALLAPFLANDKPLLCIYQGHWLFPAFSLNHKAMINNHGKQEVVYYNMGKAWKTFPADLAIFPPCAYAPGSMDVYNAPLKSPFDKQYLSPGTAMPARFRHWLGTTQNGNDVLACLLHGCSVSVSIGLFSMLIAGCAGIVLGACAGYYGNHRFRISYTTLAGLLAGILPAWFYGFEARSMALSRAFENGSILVIWQLLVSMAIACLVLYGFGRAGQYAGRFVLKNKSLYLPIDGMISRLIEVLNSIPALLLVIALSMISRPSCYTLILIIGCLGWTHIARLTRAEYLKATTLDYVTAGRAMGLKDHRIMLRHILPNVLPAVLVQVMFGVAGAVLTEASLSFIGVGVPPDVTTWGTLLNEAKDHFSAWWLVLFPGLCIFMLVLACHAAANMIERSKQPSNS